MYIRLKWKNVNTQSTTTNIYRSATFIDRTNPGTPLVTLINGETEYFDRTVTLGTSYYYVIEFVAMGSKTASRNYLFTAQFVRGHGNSQVVVGDDDYGFMGYFTFPSYTAILSMLGIKREVPNPTTDGACGVYKFSIAGKVYLMVQVSSGFVDFTTALTFLKGTGKTPVTIDEISYLAYPLDLLGPDFVFNRNYANAVQAGDVSFANRLTIPQINGVPLTGKVGESLGRVGGWVTSTYWYSKTPATSDRMAYWRNDVGLVQYATAFVASNVFPIILELVE